jgi:SH3-like domain-containing protein
MFRVRISLFTALLFCAAALPLLFAAQEFLSVQVREGQLRATPSFLGSVTAVLAYGDRVELLEDKGAWKRIALGGGKVKGWVHESAVSAKRIALRAGTASVQTGATGGELALAGKGFNPRVEAEFRNKNKNLDYAWVDRMETFAVKPAQMLAFLKQGQVTPPREEAP